MHTSFCVTSPSLFHFPTLSDHFPHPQCERVHTGKYLGSFGLFLCVRGGNTTVLLTLFLWGFWQTGEGNYLRCGVPTPPQTTYLGQSPETHTYNSQPSIPRWVAWSALCYSAPFCPVRALQLEPLGTSMKTMNSLMQHKMSKWSVSVLQLAPL